MVEYNSAQKIKAVLEEGKDVTIKAQLTISQPTNDIEIGLFYSSSLDLDSASMNTFAKLAFKSAQDR